MIEPLHRSWNATCTSLCSAQELHLRPCAANGRRDAKGGEGPAFLGLEYWEEDT